MKQFFQKHYTKILWCIFYAFTFIFLLYNSFNYLDADFGWHLKVGEQIWKEKAVPNLEYHNYTLEGKTWVDHEWLLNLFTYIIYNNFGYIALNVFFALIIVITLFLINQFTNKYFLNKQSAFFLIAPLEILSIHAMAPHIGVRMQEITILYLLLLLIIIHKFTIGKNKKILWWFIPLFYTWSCLHAGFLIGIFILFFWLSIKIFENIISKSKYFFYIDFQQNLNYKKLFTFFKFSTIAIIFTFFTPYGIKLYSFLSSYTDTYYLKNIAEWLPINHLPLNYHAFIYISIALIAYSFILYQAYKIKNIKINLWYFSLFILFLFLSFKSKRHFPLFFIVTIPYLIAVLFNILDIKSIKHNFIIYFAKFILLSIVISYTVSLAISINYTQEPFKSKLFCRSFPCDAIELLKNNSEYNNYNIFNQYGWGGFMIWTYPEKKLFIDGRLPQYEFAGHTMLKEYHEFFHKDEKIIDEKLKKYNIKLVLIENKSQKIKLNWFEKHFLFLNEEKMNEDNNHLKDYLNKNIAWGKIFENDISQIFLKTN